MLSFLLSTGHHHTDHQGLRTSFTSVVLDRLRCFEYNLLGWLWSVDWLWSFRPVMFIWTGYNLLGRLKDSYQSRSFEPGMIFWAGYDHLCWLQSFGPAMIRLWFFGPAMIFWTGCNLLAQLHGLGLAMSFETVKIFWTGCDLLNWLQCFGPVAMFWTPSHSCDIIKKKKVSDLPVMRRKIQCFSVCFFNMPSQRLFQGQ